MAVETTTNINSTDTEKISISLRDVFSYWHDYWYDTNVCAFKVNKAVYNSGYRDKHNCPWWDSVLGSDTLQSGMLPIDICVLSLVFHPRDGTEPKCQATSSLFISWSHCMKSFCSTLQNTKTLHRDTHATVGIFLVVGEDVACYVVGIWDINSSSSSTARISRWCFPRDVRRNRVSPSPAASRCRWVQVLCHQTLPDYQVISRNMIRVWIHTPHTRPFYGPLSGTTQVSWCQKRTSRLYGARED